MSEILIVGGAGYIGSHVILKLLEKKHKVVVLDDLSTGSKNAILGGCFYHGCMSDKQLLNEIFSKHDISSVMLLAGCLDVNESISNPSLYYKNNITRTLALLDSMVQHNVLQIIFSSTAAVYKSSTQKIPLNIPKIPTNPYAKSKLMVEEILKDYEFAYGMKHIVFRYFNAAGADPKGRIGYNKSATHLIPQVLKVASGRKHTFNIYGNDYATYDGTCIRDFIHVLDLAAAHYLALNHLKNTKTSFTYNLGNGIGYSVLDVVRMVKKITNINFKTVIKSKRVGDAPCVIADPSIAIERLKWQPKYSSLKDIILHAWLWEIKKHQG